MSLCLLRNSDSLVTLYPEEIRVNQDSIHLRLGGSPADEEVEREMVVTALPCAYEPRAFDGKEKIGRLFARELLLYFGARYSQMRKMSPILGRNVDAIRKLDSLTAVLIQLLQDVDPHLFRHITPFVCQIVRRRYATWAGTVDFYPQGCLYCCWIVGRLVDCCRGSDRPNARHLAVTLQWMVLLGPRPLNE